MTDEDRCASARARVAPCYRDRMHLGRLLVYPAVLLACSPKPADTDGGSASSSDTSEGAEVTSASASAPTSSANPTGNATTSDAPETFPATLPTSAESGGSSGSFDTTTDTPDTSGETGGPPGLPGACASVCMHWDACQPGSAGPLDVCTVDCIDDIDVPSVCAMASAALWSCVADLPCDEALKFLGGPDDPPPAACLDELKAVDQTCAGPECGGEITGGDDFCELEQSCDGGVVQNIHCDVAADTCTCNEDGVPGKQCPAAGFCGLDHDGQVAAVEACCGWTWMVGP